MGTNSSQIRIVGVSGGRDRAHGAVSSEVVWRALYDFRLTPNGHSNFTHLLVGAFMPTRFDNTDTLAAQWAFANEVGLIVEPAWWKKLFNRAGHVRNQRMLDTWDRPSFKSGVILQSWLFFPGAEGTHDMFTRVRDAAETVPYYAWSQKEGWLYMPPHLPWEL